MISGGGFARLEHGRCPGAAGRPDVADTAAADELRLGRNAALRGVHPSNSASAPSRMPTRALSAAQVGRLARNTKPKMQAMPQSCRSRVASSLERGTASTPQIPTVPFTRRRRPQRCRLPQSLPSSNLLRTESQSRANGLVKGYGRVNGRFCVRFSCYYLSLS